MNKTKFIALILLLSFVVLGVGYAYWNETVTIKNTVSTGELSVEFEDYDAPVSDIPYIRYDDYEIQYPNSMITPFRLSQDRHTLTAEFKDVFPGMYYSIPFKMANKGSIPAKFKKCEIGYEIENLKRTDNEAMLLSELGNNLKVGNLIFRIYNSSGAPVGSPIYCVNGPPIKLNELPARMLQSLANVRLEPGQSIQVVDNQLLGNIKLLFSGGFENDFMDREFTVDINMIWKQFNEPGG